MKDFSLQGRIELGSRLANGRPDRLRWVGDATSCSVSFNTENEDRTETFSGQRLQSARMRTATTVAISLVLRYGSAENLRLGLYSSLNNIVSAPVVDEALPSGLVANDRVVLARPAGITALSIRDSAATPATVPPANYSLENAAGGIVRLMNVTGFTQPLRASYTHEAFVRMPMFSAPPTERYFYLHGTDTVSAEKVRCALYRVLFNPISELALLNDTFGEITLEGTALFDATAALDASLGGFGFLDLQNVD